jgi:hypothetical protein
MRSSLRSSSLWIVATLLLGCDPPSSAPPTAEPTQAAPSASTPAPKPEVKAAKCSPSALAEIDRGLGQVPPELKGKALATGLVETCSAALDPVVREAFGRVSKGSPEPADVDRLPAAVYQIVDISAEDNEARASFEAAYSRLLADMRHRLTGDLRVPVMAAGSYPRNDDVEVIVSDGTWKFEGRPIDPDVRLATVVPSPGERRFVAIADVREDSRKLVGLLLRARGAGFSELGILVVRDGSYRVVSVQVGTADDEFDLPLSMREGGFYFTHEQEPEQPVAEGAETGVIDPHRSPPARGRRADVVSLRPEASLEDDTRWDYEGLAKVLPAKLQEAGRSVRVGLKAAPGVTVGALLTVFAQVTKATCPPKRKGKCGVASVALLG